MLAKVDELIRSSGDGWKELIGLASPVRVTRAARFQATAARPQSPPLCAHGRMRPNLEQSWQNGRADDDE
ncbi:hypothetical protein GCM10023176_24050 [Micromonospora coerulea]|uniref:Uncharacterized protein n=1 Tax=Micromonospora coerulea TaxID=47856 RepID=A0ABP8SGG3_9ACTN